jgi:methionine-rich copper-binding protein CopC
MRLAIGAAAVALASVLATAAPAEAHTALTSSDPAKGATVTSPARIRLTFGDPVRFTGVVVVDAHGGHHESGKSQAVDNHVTEAIAGVLAPGVYTVGWRVVAPDGHPVTGEYKFTVKGGGASASSPPASSSPPATSSAPSAPTTQPAAPSEQKGSSAGWWWIGLVILVLALAGGGVAFMRRRG